MQGDNCHYAMGLLLRNSLKIYKDTKIIREKQYPLTKKEEAVAPSFYSEFRNDSFFYLFILGIILPILLLVTIFIILRVWSNCFSKRFTS